jgi:hypothetical protein
MRSDSGHAIDQPHGADLIFFNVAPDRMITYPTGWTGPLAAIIGLLGVGLLTLGLRRRRLA